MDNYTTPTLTKARITKLSRPGLATPQSQLNLGFKIQTWVKHNKTLITQKPVWIFQIYPKTIGFLLNLGFISFVIPAEMFLREELKINFIRRFIDLKFPSYVNFRSLIKDMLSEFILYMVKVTLKKNLSFYNLSVYVNNTTQTH